MRLEVHNVQINVERIRWKHVTKCTAHYNLLHMFPSLSRAFLTPAEKFLKSR